MYGNQQDLKSDIAAKQRQYAGSVIGQGAAPDSQSEIDREAGALASALEELTVKINQLHNRLSPVCRTTDGETKGDVPYPVCSSVVGQAFQSAAVRTTQLTAQVQMLTNSLCV